MRELPDVTQIQTDFAGLWVAVREGQVVESRESPHELVIALRTRDIVGATIFRCPAEDESELVGLG